MKPGDVTELSRFTCPSCGQQSPGGFCSRCGEKNTGNEDRSVRHYLDASLDFLTSFDSKTFRSIRLLLFRPGFLSTEFLRGSRVRYTKPLALFISINVIHYLSVTWFGANTFTTPLSVQLHGNDYYPSLASHLATQRMASMNLDPAAFAKVFDEKTAVLSKTLIFLFIPIYALIFYGLFFKRRRYFADHLVVATHLWTFILLTLTVLIPSMAAVMMWRTHSPTIAAEFAARDHVFATVLQICIAIYMTLMMRRVYGTDIRIRGIAAAGIAWSFFHIVWLFRFFLFLVTLLTM